MASVAPDVPSDALEICGVCANCGKPAAFRCAACQVATYCSAKCQRVDWRLHHVVCAQQEVYADVRSGKSSITNTRMMFQPSISDSGSWGSDHMASNMMAMGMYGDHEIDTTPGAPMRRLNLSRNYAEDLQRQREIEELAQDIATVGAKVQSSLCTKDPLITEWAVIADEESALVERQNVLLNLLQGAIQDVNQATQTVCEMVRESERRNKEGKVSPPGWSTAVLPPIADKLQTLASVINSSQAPAALTSLMGLSASLAPGANDGPEDPARKKVKYEDDPEEHDEEAHLDVAPGEEE